MRRDQPELCPGGRSGLSDKDRAMSTQGIDVGAHSASQPREAVRLTTRHIENTGGDRPDAETWPLGHPRGGPNPMPAARWAGPRQPLQAHAMPDALKVFRPGGMVMVRGTCHRMPSEVESATGCAEPVGDRAAILDRIDGELHAGRPVAVSLSHSAKTEMTGDGCGRSALHVVARNYWPDGTVYYLCRDEAAHGQDIRLYVHEDDLSLVKPGLRTARYAADRESFVICVATAQG